MSIGSSRFPGCSLAAVRNERPCAVLLGWSGNMSNPGEHVDRNLVSDLYVLSFLLSFI